METENLHAPPVVAVVVVHDPGEWFDETLSAFEQQDYPNLRFLFLIAPTPAVGDAAAERIDQIEQMVTSRLDASFVRRLEANAGFGPAANEVLRLVEGQNGFFLFCHDDIAPDPDVVRLLVEELYRSNAGIVGPKLVDWDDPRTLTSVGLGIDRFGEVDQPIEPGEVDQEQHDGVRDVFVLPSACMLVRADLFRELGGFDPAIDYHGEDVELCWRTHHSGARVVVAPAARVRHRGRLVERRADLAHVRLEARHRLRTVATMTGAARLPGRALEMVLLTIAQLVVGLFTGRFREGVASLRAIVGLIPRIPSIIARRRSVASTRRVPEREVLGLQQRSSARLSSFMRHRESLAAASVGGGARRWRESTTAPVVAWIAVLALFLIGSRSFLGGGIPPVGEFLRFPDSPRDLFSSYAGSWQPNGLGETTATPTGWAALSLLSFTTLFRMGLLQTVFVLGLVVVGLIGLWKLATMFPSTRARLGALVVYAGTPLVGGAFAVGALDVLIALAAVPWMMHTLRRAVGVDAADPMHVDLDGVDRDGPDRILAHSWAEQLRRTMQFALVVALASAFEPVLFVVAAIIGGLLAVGTLLALAPWRTAVRYVAVAAAGLVFAALLNLPWIATWDWETVVGPPPIGDPGRGVGDLAAFQLGSTNFSWLVLAWYVPVLAAVLLAKAWRLTWAIRSGIIVVGFAALAVFGDLDRLPFAAPSGGVLLVPVAVGLAISAAAALAAFDLDVRGGSFGWRQPLGLAASAAIVIGLVPGALSIGSGDWDMPSVPLIRLVEKQLPDVPEDADGDYHVLLLGDARLLPLPAVEYRNGLSFAVMSDDDLDVRARWEPTRGADDVIIEALDQIAAGSTQRGGRLLAPLGIRYIVIPEFDGIVSTSDDPLELPLGVIEAFDEQLDIVSTQGLPTFELFENSAAIPTYSLLAGPTAEASRAAGAEALVRADLSDVTAVFVGANSLTETTAQIPAGVVHLAVPFDDRWALEVDGRSIEPRRAFGVTTAFDVDQGGTATLSYRDSGSRPLVVALQFVLWAAAIYVASRISLPFARRQRSLVAGETLITLDALGDLDADDADAAAFDPGMDMTGQIARATDLDDDPEVAEGSDGGIDERTWVDELMASSIEDPIGLIDDQSEEDA